ncbi:hypothetical protein ACFOEP_12745 [Microbacterium amylolyticum]|uniref:hypothetical protein n=1 Tax=Microbacterium amylolyticum TaxID=936337 RepID=UPI00361C5B87
MFARGTRARIALAVPAALVGALVAAWLAPEKEALAAALMAVAITLGGLTASWYLIGLGTPLPLIGFELVPRAAATAAGGVIVVLGGPVWSYPVLLIIAVVGGIAAYASRVMSLSDLMRGWRESARFARRQLSAAGTETVSGAYTALAVSLVTMEPLPPRQRRISPGTSCGGSGRPSSGPRATRCRDGWWKTARRTSAVASAQR